MLQPSLRIINRFPIIPDKKNRYLSFPTAAIDNNGDILIAYRDASFEGDILPADYGEHGVKGDMFLLNWDNDKKIPRWQRKIYDHKYTGYNEQNTILTTIDDKIYIFSRQYGGSDKVFIDIASSEIKDLGGRKEVTIPQFEFFACYGHIRRWGDKLLAPVYAVPHNSVKRLGAYWIYSEDSGDSWHFGGSIASPVVNGPSFNETAIIPLSNMEWLAVIRSGDSCEELYYSYSYDNLERWKLPMPLGFKGEAPELFSMKDGVIGLTYRGFLCNDRYSFSMRLSADHGKSWGEAVNFAEYSGSRFHGGYGDIVYLHENKWLGVYYAPGESFYPAIWGVEFEV